MVVFLQGRRRDDWIKITVAFGVWNVGIQTKRSGQKFGIRIVIDAFKGLFNNTDLRNHWSGNAVLGGIAAGPDSRRS